MFLVSANILCAIVHTSIQLSEATHFVANELVTFSNMNTINHNIVFIN
jgi:hypothetical protein